VNDILIIPMKALLNNERAPVTFGGGFIKVSFSEYCNAFTSWWKGLQIDFESSSFPSDLKEAMLRLEPLQNPQNRYLITETQSNWTPIFSNSRGGSDVSSTVSYLCKVLGCHGVEIQCSPSLTKREGNKTSIVSYAATSFTLVGPHETEWLNEIRHVSARSGTTKTNTFAIASPPRCWSPTVRRRASLHSMRLSMGQGVFLYTSSQSFRPHQPK